MKLLYVLDAYCGWSHGFSPTIIEIARRNPDLPVDVVSGGMFTGERRVPIRELGFIGGANARITSLTGAEFGDGYQRLIDDGSFVLDSEAAARGVAALRQAAPERAVELAVAAQRAFFIDGHSLSAPATYRKIAEAAGLDADAVVAAFQAPEAQATPVSSRSPKGTPPPPRFSTAWPPLPAAEPGPPVPRGGAVPDLS